MIHRKFSKSDFLMMQDAHSHHKQVIFTIADADYAAMAMIMFDSVSKHYQDSDLFLFVIGTGNVNQLDNNVNVIYIGDVLDELDLHQRLVYYLQVELATSIKPQCFEFLFAQHYNRVIYLDPDIYVVRRMTEIDSLLDGNVNGVVTPHALKSLKSNIIGEDNVFLQCGIYNLGFLALKNTPETLRMMTWWKEKLKWQCIVDLRNGYFVDQKWLDFLPAYFEGFHVLKSPAYNLAPWNSEHYEVLSDSYGNFYINDFEHPIAFIHFSGIKRAVYHYAFLKEARMYYLEQLKKYKFKKFGFLRFEIRYKLDNMKLDKICTFLYKEYINHTKNTSTDPFTDIDFYNFLNSVDTETKLPVYVRKLFEILPDIFVGYLNTKQTINYDNLITWMKNNFNYDGVVSLETMVHLRNNSIGSNYKIKYTDASIKTSFQGDSGKPSYFPSLLSFAKEIIVKSDRIEIFDGDVRVCIPNIDNLKDFTDIKTKNYTELWVPSFNCKKKLHEKYGLTNITVIPFPVLQPKYKVQKIDFPINKFVVLMHHDFDRDFTAQKSLESLMAFQEGFDDRDDGLLICFFINAKQSEDYKKLLAACQNRKNIKIIENKTKDDLYYSYLHYADCFISMHDQAAFGYELNEAMSLGKYVITIRNDDNKAYINPNNSFLIETSSSHSYITTGAKMLNEIYDNNNALCKTRRLAALTTEKHLSPNIIGFMMQKRLELLKLEVKKSKLNIYMKLKQITAYLFLAKNKNNQDEINQIETIMKILLKNVNRPDVLE